MATLYLTEYQGYSTQGQMFQAALEPEITTQTKAIGTVVNANAFSKNTYLIRVHVDAICSILVSSGGTGAAVTNKRLAANQTEYFAVKPGHILSVIANT